jgi:hypothetical protein
LRANSESRTVRRKAKSNLWRRKTQLASARENTA